MAQASFRAMGTTVAVLAPAARLERAAAAVRELFERWEAALSRFRPESELSRLNARAGQEVPVSPLLLSVLQMALDAARATDGLYDPTLREQIVRLGYDRSFELLGTESTAEIAEDSEIRTRLTAENPEITEGGGERGSASGADGANAALDKNVDTEVARPGGGWRQIVVDALAGTVTLPRGCGLDFGGIAKGMAVDAAIEALRRRGLTSALVNAGGDLAVLGLPPGEPQWSLAVPGRDGWWSIPLVCGALATSGVARRHWSQDGAPRHHLLDPRTGLPAQMGLWSATVGAADCARAEVAAKVAFILGRGEGSAFLRRLGLGGLLVGADGLWSTEGSWPALEMESLA